MSRKEILIIFLIFCCLFSLQAVAATGDGNSTDSVVLTTDSDVSAYSLPNLDNQLRAGSGNAGTFSDLQDDISNGKLERNYTYNSSDSGLANGITISSDLTIDGEGKVTIDAKNQARVFNIASGATVTIKGITFINGNALGNGGSISSSGVLTLIDCKFINNTASGHGGAVYMDHSTRSTIDNCEFNDNVAGLNGGAIDWRYGSTHGKVINSTFTNNTAKRSGGAIHWSGHDGTIRDSIFTNNTAAGKVISEIGGITGGGDGGAVLWVGSNGTVNNCKFIDNHAIKNDTYNLSGRGGAIFLHGNITENCTNTTVSNSIFRDNFAGLNGGAIDWQDGAHDGNIYNSTFTHNIANANGGAVFWSGHDGNVYDSIFTNNSAEGTITDIHGNIGDGGAIIWSGINGAVDNCRFIDNKAKFNDAYTFGGRGGAVYLQNCTNTIFTNVYFENNIAGTNGGAIDWHDGAHDGLVENATFINNTAKRSGGAIFWDGHNGTIRYTKFYDNRALGEVNATSVLGPVTSGGDGGAVMWSGAMGDIEYCNFVNNTAAKRGGAVFLQASEEEDSDNAIFRHSYFKNNTAGTNGGAIDWNKGSHNGIVDNVTFIDNTAKRSGGAIFWFGMNGTVINSKFINNSALGSALANDSYGNMTYGGHGGAILWTGSNGTVQNVTFDKNTAEVSGGAVFLQGSDDYGDCFNVVVKDSKFINNVAGVNGGALDWYEGALNGTVDNCIFTNNTALNDGGAIFWNGQYGTINASIFVNNKAVGLGNGALISTTYNPNTNETENRYNITGGDGGAIKWIGSHGIIIDTTFYRNNASYNGGSIYLTGTATENCTNITFINCDFTENLAKLNGGAVFWASGASNTTVKGSHFISNTALRSAGAIYVNGNYLEIKDTEFIGNDAACTQTYDNRTGSSYYTSLGGNAGAICWMGSYGTVDNGTFINNTANGRGGAIQFERNRDGIVKNSLFENNSANDDGGAIDWYLGAINGQLINSTFKSNYIVGNNGSGAGVFIEGYNATIKDSRFYDHYTNLDGGAVYVAGDECKIFDSTFERNSVGDDGGAIYWEGDNGTIVNITCHDNHGISYNTSTSRGGAVSLTGSNITITKSKFTCNDVSYSEGSNMSKLDGGAMLITGRNITISDTEFSNNYALNYGGAIMIIGNETTIDNCTFDTSNATCGGAIYVDGNNATISAAFKNTNATLSGGAIYVEGEYTLIEGSNFVDSTAKFRGGALYIDGANAKVKDSNFTDSSVSGKKYGANNPRGGAIYIKAVDATIEGSIFNRSAVSESVGQGGAIFIEGDNAKILGSEFESSSAKTGGAIYLEGNSCNVTESTFTYSYAKENGGAMYSTGSSSTVYNSNFTYNLAEESGGALYWFGGSRSKYNTVDGCIFTNNTAHGNVSDQSATRGGGAIYWSEHGEYGTVKNSEFYYNSVQSTIDWKVDGGAILWDKSYHALVENCDFVGNFVTTEGDSGSSAKASWAQGGAMYLRPYDNYTVRNCLFENCSSSKEAGALYIQSNNPCDSG